MFAFSILPSPDAPDRMALMNPYSPPVCLAVARNKCTVAIICLCLLQIAAGGEPTPRAAKPCDGVYFTWTGFETTVIELKQGRFRYWFASDDKGSEEPAYPLSGTFTTSGNTITLKHPQVYRSEWVSQIVEDAFTLWLPEGIKAYRKDKSFLDLARLRQQGLGAVLVLTHKSAEEIWKHPYQP